MSLQYHSIEKLKELKKIVLLLNEGLHIKSFKILSDATIGQHIRLIGFSQ